MLRIALITALLLAQWGVFNLGQKYGTNAVNSKWAAERLATSQANAAQVKLAADRALTLSAEMARLTTEKTNENLRTSARYESIIVGLRERPLARAGVTGVPPDAPAGAGCTGAGLARPDAEFLAGYAADAARLQSALARCQSAYNAARLSLP